VRSEDLQAACIVEDPKDFISFCFVFIPMCSRFAYACIDENPKDIFFAVIPKYVNCTVEQYSSHPSYLHEE
jgi:hypothetical protein